MAAGLPGVEWILGFVKNVVPRRDTWRYAALAGLALGLAACGGGDDAPADQPGQNDPPSQNPPQGDPDDDPPSAGNRAPTISGNPSTQVLVGESYSFTPTASDPDGDVLTFTIQNRPSWASFDESTGRLSGTPDEDDVGAYPGIRIRASDGDATASLSSFTIEVVTSATGSATLSWQPVTQRTDGTPADLAGYRVYWGKSSRNYSNSVMVQGADRLVHTIDNLTPATWYFAVTAVDAFGVESEYSNEASKQIL